VKASGKTHEYSGNKKKQKKKNKKGSKKKKRQKSKKKTKKYSIGRVDKPLPQELPFSVPERLHKNRVASKDTARGELISHREKSREKHSLEDVSGTKDS